jgi:hypothetical protein
MAEQLRQAAQQALKALNKLSKLGNGNQDGNSLGNTIAQEAREHLFTALAQPEQEPVAWPAGLAEYHRSLLNIGKVMAKELSREIGDAWDQLADFLDVLQKALEQPQQERRWLTKELMADYFDVIAEAVENNNSEILRHKSYWLRAKGDV